MSDVSTTNRYDAAVAYIRQRKWAIIPLYGVRADGACACPWAASGDQDHLAGGKAVGKHPIGKGWQAGPALSQADAFAVWCEAHPEANLGIRTGRASGLFVLDVDPDNGGNASLDAMIAANGPLPQTYTVRTGSGGRHYYWTLPAFEVRNGANRELVHRYGPGLDIRGEGGQVVAPPSRTGKGEYLVISPVDPVPAPAWLLELLQATGDAMPPTDSPVVEDLPAYADLDRPTQARVQRYAETVLELEERTYVDAAPGTGNATLFSSACSMIEIAQSPWNTITVAEVWKRLERARAQRQEVHPYGGGQSVEEFSQTWESARQRVVGQGRELPRDPTSGVTFDPSLFLPEGEAVQERVAPPANREEAKSLVDQLLDRMLTRDELDDLPLPTPLIRDVLDQDSESWIIGAPGGFKSFVALDMACHVALGRAWRGKPVSQGSVVYVIAEGSKSIQLRARAWEQVYGERIKDIHFLPEPVQVADQVAWQVLVEACRRLGPVMVIIDTQARCTVGLDENSNGQMSVLTEAVRKLKEATRACVLVVHHTGRNGQDARGASAIDGAQDTELKVERPAGDAERRQLTATVTIPKSKDGSEAEEFPLQLEVQELGTDPRDGRPLTSLAIKPVDPFQDQPTRPAPDWEANLTDNQSTVLRVMRAHADHDGATPSQIHRWIRAWAEDGRARDMPETSLSSALKALKAQTIVVALGRARYALQEHLDA